MDLSKILSEKEKNENIKLNLKKDNGIEKKGTKILNDKKGTKIKYKKNKLFSIIGEIPGYRKKNNNNKIKIKQLELNRTK